jgi:hypothetical protein
LLLASMFVPGAASAEPQQTHPPVCLGPITTGKNSLYHTQDVARSDLSGAATDGHYIIFDDDGGDKGPPNFGFDFVRVTTDLPDNGAFNIPLAEHHSDLEAATFLNGYYYISTSMSSSAPAQQLVTRFKLDAYHGQLLDEESVNIMADLKEALRLHYGDEWYDSWKTLPAKSGGLNIEGMSRTDNDSDTLLFGLRSPLVGGDFPADLKSGSTIIARVTHAFGKQHGTDQGPKFDFITVNLGGYGVRGMEWVPATHSYVISAGPVEKATDYHLWQLFPDGYARPLDLPGYNQLCRPESVIQQTKDGKNYLVVLSEDSGPECDGVPFDFIRAEILPEGSCQADAHH